MQRFTWCPWGVLATASSSSWHSGRWPGRPSPDTRSRCRAHPAQSWGLWWEPGIWPNRTVPLEQRWEEMNHHLSFKCPPMFLILRRRCYPEKQYSNKTTETDSFSATKALSQQLGTKGLRRCSPKLTYSFNKYLLSILQVLVNSMNTWSPSAELTM